MTIDTKGFIELEAAKVSFLSQHDEAAFFEWIGKIPSVTKAEGSGYSIFLHVDGDAIDEEDLRELISLFRRYGVSMKQLSVFDRQPFTEFLHDKNAYWSYEIFGG